MAVAFQIQGVSAQLYKKGRAISFARSLISNFRKIFSFFLKKIRILPSCRRGMRDVKPYYILSLYRIFPILKLLRLKGYD